MTKPPLYKLKSTLRVCSGAFAVFSAYCLYKEDEKFYDGFVMPLAHTFSPETSHRLAVAVNKYRLLPKSQYSDPSCLKTKVWDLSFSNPIGMAAGFDKDGEAIKGLHELGFGFVEIGSVTPEPQPGNEKPRVFRLKENSAIINRYGFNSEGHTKVYERIKELRENNFQGIVGVNLGKNKYSKDPIGDYVKGIKTFGPVADYLVINISSPNTPGLRDWQNKEQLKELLIELVRTRDSLEDRKPPLLVKLAPDLSQSQRADIAKLVTDKKCRIDGLVISNTSVERGNLTGKHVNEEGGLSGKPLSDTSTQMISEMYNLTKGQIPIIGVGGVFSGEDAYKKIKAGASLVQMYTAFVYHGPPRVSRIKNELYQILKSSEYENVTEAVGKENKL
ncbi:dihydroorotate dehydrogenase (quinone), mitochondrial [Cimex lectularius]|uniref:Dihydroorotate dehydrogenase (quinone), mitochondrial n=1 Tax=Cimex lectularius TaxID=79782 RepID=A0A8I6RU89_CIMLE|nr:dihydroorotate dehydrogenase (quinone), mitochondrial [Cimex lectularius]